MSNTELHEPDVPVWFDLMTDDLEGARKFYSALFGWEYEIGPATTGFYSIAKRGGKKCAGLGQKPSDTPFPNAWTVYFHVLDCDASCEAAKAKGGTVSMAPMDVMEEGRMAMVADATGAMYGLWQAGNHKGSEVQMEHGSMTWCEINTRDIDRAKTYYSEVFDLEARDMEMEGARYATLNKGEVPHAGIMQMTEEWGDMPPHWMVYFAVDDADVTAKAVGDNGGSVNHGPFDTPFGRMAVCTDPTGTAFSIIKPTQP